MSNDPSEHGDKEKKSKTSPFKLCFKMGKEVGRSYINPYRPICYGTGMLFRLTKKFKTLN